MTTRSEKSPYHSSTLETDESACGGSPLKFEFLTLEKLQVAFCNVFLFPVYLTHAMMLSKYFRLFAQAYHFLFLLKIHILYCRFTSCELNGVLYKGS